MGMGNCYMHDLVAFLLCIVEILGKLVFSGAVAAKFCCHISVTNKEQQGRKGP